MLQGNLPWAHILHQRLILEASHDHCPHSLKTTRVVFSSVAFLSFLLCLLTAWKCSLKRKEASITAVAYHEVETPLGRITPNWGRILLPTVHFSDPFFGSVATHQAEFTVKFVHLPASFGFPFQVSICFIKCMTKCLVLPPSDCTVVTFSQVVLAGIRPRWYRYCASHVVYQLSTIIFKLEQMLYKSFLLLQHIVRRIVSHW